MNILKQSTNEETRTLRIYTQEMSMSWTFNSVLQMYAADTILREIGLQLSLSDIANLFNRIKRKENFNTFRDASIFVYEYLRGELL